MHEGKCSKKKTLLDLMNKKEYLISNEYILFHLYAP